jgi:hypothetical protein
MKYEPIWTLFQGFKPLFGSMDPDPDPHQRDKQDQDPHQSDKQDPDPKHCDKERKKCLDHTAFNCTKMTTIWSLDGVPLFISRLSLSVISVFLGFMSCPIMDMMSCPPRGLTTESREHIEVHA